MEHFCILTGVADTWFYAFVKAHGNLHQKQWFTGTSLTVQWLGLHVSTAGIIGSIPGQGTKIPQAAQCHQKKKKKKKKLTQGSLIVGHKVLTNIHHYCPQIKESRFAIFSFPPAVDIFSSYFYLYFSAYLSLHKFLRWKLHGRASLVAQW